jgi:hypothetical protein
MQAPAVSHDPRRRGPWRGAWRTAARAVFSPGNRTLLIALTALLTLIFLVVGSNVAASHEPRPHDLPVGIAGPPGAVSAIRSQLDRSAPGAFAISTYSSTAAARTAILRRSIYGALDLGPPPVLLVASAASRPAAALLEETFQAAAQAQRQHLVIRDLVPLPSSDSSGATAFSVTVSLVVGAVLGSSIIFLVTRRRPLTVRLAALIALVVGAGVLTALVTNVIVGAFTGQFLAIWGEATLFFLAMALPIAAFQVLFGLPGTAAGLQAFSVVGAPSSGGSSTAAAA